ncbi:MAG: hypothetical protein RO009_23240 [Pseudorhodoplanes sp.]|jgi:hypothetical protein|nr:hypothetical protein [Pseudorhodoplanes sp.]
MNVDIQHHPAYASLVDEIVAVTAEARKALGDRFEYIGDHIFIDGFKVCGNEMQVINLIPLMAGLTKALKRSPDAERSAIAGYERPWRILDGAVVDRNGRGVIAFDATDDVESELWLGIVAAVNGQQCEPDLPAACP